MCVDSNYEAASRMSQLLQYSSAFPYGVAVVGELHQDVAEGRDNVDHWRGRRDVLQQLRWVVMIVNIDICSKFILDQSCQSNHLSCMIVPVELNVHFGTAEVVVHYPGEKAGTTPDIDVYCGTGATKVSIEL